MSQHHPLPALPVACPECGGILVARDSQYRCEACSGGFDVVAGDNGGTFINLMCRDVPNASVSYSSVDERWIRNMLEFERKHFWPRNRAEFILELVQKNLPVGASIVDFGCGLGYVAKKLHDHGYQVMGVEGTRELAECAAMIRGIPVIGAVIDALDFTRPSDAASLFDVMEHCADDALCLGQAKRAVRPGGNIFVTVPAHPMLWSASDTAGGHFRRYMKHDMERLAAQCDLELIQSGYFMMSLFPAVLVSRFLQRNVPEDQAIAEQHKREFDVSPAINKIFNGILKMEKLVWSRGMPIGTSLYAVFGVPE